MSESQVLKVTTDNDRAEYLGAIKECELTEIQKEQIDDFTNISGHNMTYKQVMTDDDGRF